MVEIRIMSHWSQQITRTVKRMVRPFCGNSKCLTNLYVKKYKQLLLLLAPQNLHNTKL